MLASARAVTFFDLRASELKSRACPGEGRGRGAARLGLLDYRGGAEHEPPPQVLIALLADPAEPLPAGGRVLARREADPGGKVPARAKGLGVRHPRFRKGRLLSAKLTPPTGPTPGIVAKHWLA